MITPEDITDEILVALRKIIRAIDLQSKALVHQCGLTGTQLVVLKELSRRGEMSAGLLAKRVSLSQATVTGVIDRLVKRNLVVKIRDDSDRRKVKLSCTDEGKQLSGAVPSVLQEKFTQQLFQLETWEQNLILSTLQRINSMMQAETISAEPILITGPLHVTPEVTKQFLDPVSHKNSQTDDR